jgi:GT2 family glycosyltransferase
MTLSIVIVNYNVKYFVEQCLRSIVPSAIGIVHEVFVVDNASTDGSREYLEPRFQWVRFIWNRENRGFAVANNQALAVAKGQFVLFLNPDTIISEECLSACIDHFRKHGKAGAIGIRMLDGSGRFLRESKRSFVTPLTAFYKLSGLASLFPKSPVFARYHQGHLDPLKNHQTEVLAGAFMMVRKNVLDKTGGFDEQFFMYGEDIDLCYRIRKAGYENHYLSHPPIIHFKGESTSRHSLKYVRMFYGAMAIFARKHYGGWKSGLFTACIHLAIWARAMATVLLIPFRRHLFRFFKSLASLSTSILDSTSDGRGQILIAADPIQYQRIVAGIKSDAGSWIPGRIALEDRKHARTSKVVGIRNILKRMDARELIICPPACSYAEIIGILDGLDLSCRFSISVVGSDSIVSSGQSGPVDES